MAFADGDFVKVEYSAWREADRKLVYTTSKRVAEENGSFDEKGRYAPQLIVLGKGNTIKGVENAIRGMSVDETKKVEIQPGDAFGYRNNELVKVMPLADFRKRDIDPYPGMSLDIDGSAATVKSVNSGRVVVDINHPLAGEKLLYEIKVVAKLDRDEDRVRALAEMYALAPDSVVVNSGKAMVVFGDNVEKDANYLINKNDFVHAVVHYMGSIRNVTVEESYPREKVEAADKK